MTSDFIKPEAGIEHAPAPAIQEKAKWIRSFVRRQGRMTASQKKALGSDWSAYMLGAPAQEKYDFRALFGRCAPCVLEIGFGMGDALVALARAQPERNFIGVEVYGPGVGHCLALIKKYALTNLRIANQDARLVLESMPEQSLEKVLLYFPDPWPKTRHQKRRLVQSEFVMQVAQCLQGGGTFHLATDWAHYADQMLQILEACSALKNAYGSAQFAPTAWSRLQTKFERRAKTKGHAIFDLIYTRVCDTHVPKA